MKTNLVSSNLSQLSRVMWCKHSVDVGSKTLLAVDFKAPVFMVWNGILDLLICIRNYNG